MVFTQHGHHIEGSPMSSEAHKVARCGGPRICRPCALDVAAYWSNFKATYACYGVMDTHADSMSGVPHFLSFHSTLEAALKEIPENMFKMERTADQELPRYDVLRHFTYLQIVGIKLKS